MKTKQIKNKRYFLIQVFLRNNSIKIEQTHLLCDYFKTQGYEYILNYTTNENQSEFLIEVDKQTFYEYKF